MSEPVVDNPAFVPGPSTASEKPTPPIPAKPAPIVPQAPAPGSPRPRPVPLMKTPVATPVRTAPAVPDGWWSVKPIKGSKTAVAKAVSAQANIPAHWQAALQAEIAAHDSPAISVTAHFLQQNKVTHNGAVKTTSKGQMTLHLTIQPLEGHVTD